VLCCALAWSQRESRAGIRRQGEGQQQEDCDHQSGQIGRGPCHSCRHRTGGTKPTCECAAATAGAKFARSRGGNQVARPRRRPPKRAVLPGVQLRATPSSPRSPLGDRRLDNVTGCDVITWAQPIWPPRPKATARLAHRRGPAVTAANVIPSAYRVLTFLPGDFNVSRSGSQAALLSKWLSWMYGPRHR
jgi:hypothetical protein